MRICMQGFICMCVWNSTGISFPELWLQPGKEIFKNWDIIDIKHHIRFRCTIVIHYLYRLWNGAKNQTRLSDWTTLLSSFHNRLLLLYSYLIKNAKIPLLYISSMQFCPALLSTATPSIRLQMPLAGMAITLLCLQSILYTLSTHDYLFNSCPLSLGIKS